MNKYSLQVLSLANQNKVKVLPEDIDSEFSYAQRYRTKKRRETGYAGEIGLHLWPIRTEIGYCTALHELGHVLSPHQRKPKPQDILARKLRDKSMLSDNYLWNELTAWYWARSTAYAWTTTMQAEEQRCLKSYAGRWRWEDFGLQSAFTGRLKLDAWYSTEFGM